MMEIGPVLVVTFQAQQIAYVLDAAGKLIDGDPVNQTTNFLTELFIVR